MEAIGAGAGILAFVTLGIKSAKVIHDILSSYRDSNKNVEQTTNNVASLQASLERFSRCRHVCERPDEALATKVKQCADDTSRFADDLKRLSVNNGATMERKWQKIKAFFKEKDLAKFSTVIVGHTAALNFYLDILDSDTLGEVKDELGAFRRDHRSAHQAISQSHATLISQQASMTQTFQGTFTKIIDDSQVLCHKTQSLEAATRNAYDETRNLHDTVRTAMESSETKQGDIVRMLNQLLELSLKHDTGSRVVEEVDDSGQLLNKAANQSIQADEELSECIDAIVRSIQDKEGVFGVHEVEEVADAMIVLLKIISSEQSRYFTSDCSSGSTTERELKDLRRNLMAVQGMVMCSRTISLNKTVSKDRDTGTVLKTRFTKRSHELPFGAISVTSLERSWKKRRSSEAGTLTTLEHKLDVVDEVQTRICYLPKLTKGPHGFQATLHRFHYGLGTSNAIPRLSVVNILPAGSRVFVLVQLGRLREFQEMLASGEASLRDQDEHGTSLLQYASRNLSICRFLLQHGADVDHVGPGDDTRMDSTDCLGTTLVSVHRFSSADTPSQMVDCHKLLIEHGCDPTIQTILRDRRSKSEDLLVSPFFTLISLHGTHPTWVALLNSPFVTMDMVSNLGMTPLLAHCDGGQYTVFSFRLLLSRGSDIRARDMLGNTCLHLCFNSMGIYETLEPRDKWNAIRYLCDCGADIFATNNEGQSVSALAYDSNTTSSSFSGDLWDFVLAQCGHDIAQFRKSYKPREAKYRGLYTRQVFEEMWQGQEERCPYYYDEEPRRYYNDEERGLYLYYNHGTRTRKRPPVRGPTRSGIDKHRTITHGEMINHGESGSVYSDGDEEDGGVLLGE